MASNPLRPYSPAAKEVLQVTTKEKGTIQVFHLHGCSIKEFCKVSQPHRLLISSSNSASSPFPTRQLHHPAIECPAPRYWQSKASLRRAC